MNLFEDALRCHDELELSFAHVLREKNLSWFGTLIIPAAKDDSLPLLSITKKPYRDLIVANTISVFDLRIYILSNQCALLGKMGKVTDVCRKAAVFLASFGRHLREVSVSEPCMNTIYAHMPHLGHSTTVFHRVLDVFFGTKRDRASRYMGE